MGCCVAGCLIYKGSLFLSFCSCVGFSFCVLEVRTDDEHQINIGKSCETQKFILEVL